MCFRLIKMWSSYVSDQREEYASSVKQPMVPIAAAWAKSHGSKVAEALPESRTRRFEAVEGDEDIDLGGLGANVRASLTSRVCLDLLTYDIVIFASVSESISVRQVCCSLKNI